ncbi:MAG: hypothetical protein ACXWT0_01760 [Methylobacter sp.]
MIESKGLVGDYPLKKFTSKRVADDFSKKINKRLAKYDAFVKRGSKKPSKSL